MLELQNICKAFGSVEVLKGISFELKTGETLGLVGENGAGKSTLMNILGGITEASAGSIMFDGTPYRPTQVSDSQQQGIAFIHQELNLFPNLSIAENLFINNFPKKQGWLGSFIDHGALDTQAKALLLEVGMDTSPSTLVEELTNGQQQLVEIAKALRGKPKLIIFDEPTTALSQQETDRFITLVGKLKQKGISMIFISHNLDEVKAIADSVAVIRDGELIQKMGAANYSKANIIRDMVGRDLAQFFPARSFAPGSEVKMELDKLKVDQSSEVSFKVRRQEVLGLYGLVGAGRSEMARTLFGLQKAQGGRVIWNGKPCDHLTPGGWIKKGLVYVTEDRREEGILSFKGIRENVQLASLPQYAHRLSGWLNYQRIRSKVLEKVSATKVKYQDIERQEITELSGGNQQKVLLSRWLMVDPELLILDEPTKGIDIGAREEIYHLINELVQQGASVLLISSEIEELLGMCDRILVMNQGHISATFQRSEFDQPTILKYALNTIEDD